MSYFFFLSQKVSQLRRFENSASDNIIPLFNSLGVPSKLDAHVSIWTIIFIVGRWPSW